MGQYNYGGTIVVICSYLMAAGGAPHQAMISGRRAEEDLARLDSREINGAWISPSVAPVDNSVQRTCGADLLQNNVLFMSMTIILSIQERNNIKPADENSSNRHRLKSHPLTSNHVNVCLINSVRYRIYFKKYYQCSYFFF